LVFRIKGKHLGNHRPSVSWLVLPDAGMARFVGQSL
jgi:hypothetical protein